MKLTELKEMVEEMEMMVGEENAHNVEVRWAAQPSWPMEYTIEPNWAETEEGDDVVIYLAEDQQLGYLPGAVKEYLGW